YIRLTNVYPKGPSAPKAQCFKRVSERSLPASRAALNTTGSGLWRAPPLRQRSTDSLPRYGDVVDRVSCAGSGDSGRHRGWRMQAAALPRSACLTIDAASVNIAAMTTSVGTRPAKPSARLRNQDAQTTTPRKAGHDAQGKSGHPPRGLDQ